MTKEYTVASLFAGIGGIDLGFKNSGFKPIWANEIDKNCVKTFKLNNPDTFIDVGDIHNVPSEKIPTVDVITGGFPCQPFSLAGYRLGFEDDRGNLFFEIIRILKDMKSQNRMPKVVFLENVKNIHNHNNGETYKKIKETLSDLGYYITGKVMNASEYGNVPQNRKRLFIIGFIDEDVYKNFKWPEKIKLTNTLDKVIDFKEIVDEKYYYTEKSKVFPLVKSYPFESGLVYQIRRIYIRVNKSSLSPTLIANMGTGGNNVPVIKDCNSRIRKFTPRETLLLQGFPKDFKIPDKMADSHVYKQCGNSVCVSLVERISNRIKIALESSLND